MKNKARRFTLKEDQFIRRNYLKIPAKRISKMLGRSEGTTRQRMKILGLSVPKELKEKFLSDSRFKKGHVPLNKGKKVNEYMSEEAIQKSIATRWRPGHRPINEKPNGSITIRTDRSGRKYKWIRISMNNWEMLHIHLWKKAHGKIPNGKIVVFINKDSLDARLENLMLITPEENMLRNSIHQYPDELVSLMQLKGRITKKINKTLNYGKR